MQTEERFLDFGFEKWPAYLNSPVRHVVEHRKLCRWRLDDGEPLPFPVLEEHRSAGYVDYAIAPMIFSDGRINAVSWATDRPGGFSDVDLRFFEEVLSTYSTIVEVKSLRRFATNVLSTYVGREPGELIMKGQIRRGDVRTIKAALMMVRGEESGPARLHRLVRCASSIRGHRDTQSLLRLRHSAYQDAWWRDS